MSHHSGKKVVLVGAGPAGLTTGLLLAKRGWNVVIFEKRGHPKEEAIVNGQRSIINALMRRSSIALEEAGFELPKRRKGETWKNNVAVCKGVTFVSPKTGKTRFVEDMVDNRDFCWITERDAMTEALANLALSQQSNKIQIHFKSRIGNIDFQKKRIQFTLESGISDMVEYDLLIGADGRNSIVRKMLAEVDPSIKFEAKLNGKSWKSFTGLPALDRLKLNTKDGTSFIIYSSAPTRIVVWPTRNNTIGGYMTQPTSFWKEDKNNVEDYKKLVRKTSPQFPEEWLNQTAQQLSECPIGHIGTAWCNSACGPCTVLIGDSGNAITPLLGQGVNSALESCFIFAQELDKYDDIQKACQAFDDRRTPDLHALTLLDKEGLERIGAMGPFKIRFIAFALMQYIVWKQLHKRLPFIFGQTEVNAITDTLSYRKALDGYKRDESIIRTIISISIGIIAFFILKFVHRLLF